MPRKGENITKRSDGRWEARVKTGIDLHGKTTYRYLYASSYDEAKRKKDNCEKYVCFGSVLDEYLEYKKQQIKESSFARYQSIVKKHIIPALGELNVHELSYDVFADFMKNKLSVGRLDGTGGLSPKRVQDIISVLRQVVSFSFRRGYIDRDIKISSPKRMKKQTEILTVPEEKCLVEYALKSNSSRKFGVVIALYTGLRIGELCALRWSDIDLENNIISITKTLQRVSSFDGGERKTKILINTPKTSAGIRQIPIPSFLVPYFIKYKKTSLSDDSYVITGTKSFTEPSNYYSIYRKWLGECFIGPYSFHALRHTFATRCVEKGFDPKTLSEILGHSDVAITMSLYVHPSLEYKRANMERLSNVFSSRFFQS